MSSARGRSLVLVPRWLLESPAAQTQTLPRNTGPGTAQGPRPGEATVSQCRGHGARPQQPLRHGLGPETPRDPQEGAGTHIRAAPQHRLSESITAACVTLAAIKGFKEQFLTFMNKWPWMDDSGSIQSPARKCQQKPSLFHVGG